MTIRNMCLDDLRLVLNWAAAEGWNPGLNNAEAFYAADPDGFFLNEVDGTPAAAISVVNHNDQFAFSGLYICRPEFRGRGYGMEVWKAGMGHAGVRCVGLDGVPDQQTNYVRSGFARHGQTVRYKGSLNVAAAAQGFVADASDLETIIMADNEATGYSRYNFAKKWFEATKTRQTILLPTDLSDIAFATFRQCEDGVKVGPFQANTIAQAEALLASCPKEMAVGPIFLDVPDTSQDLAAFLVRRGFLPAFETARMYSSAPPRGAPPDFYSVASLEVG